MGRFAQIQSRGTVSIPAEIRHRAGLDTPGAQVEVTLRDDGVIELRPLVPVAADQAWFWTDRWQRMEREADESYAKGQGRVHDSTEAFVAFLDEIEFGTDASG